MVDGNLTIVDNSEAEVIDLGNLTVVGGNLTIHDNGETQIILGNLAVVDGNLTIQSHGSGTFSVPSCVGGSSTLDLFGYATLQAVAAPGGTTITMEDGSVIPLDLEPALSVYAGTCAADGPSTTLIVPDDAGQSDGWRYDTNTRTWIFGWNTRSLAAGCYWLQFITHDPAFPTPASMFPIALRDR